MKHNLPNMWTSSNTSVNQQQQFSGNDSGNQPIIEHVASSSAYFNGGLLNHQEAAAAASSAHENVADFYNACHQSESRSDAGGNQISYYYNHPHASQAAQQYFFNGGLNFDYNSFIAEPSSDQYEHALSTGSNCNAAGRSAAALSSVALRHIYQAEDGNDSQQGQLDAVGGQHHQQDAASSPLSLSHVHQLSHGLYYSANNTHFSSNYHLYSQMSINSSINAKPPSLDIEQGQLCSTKMKEIANRLTLSSSSSSEGAALSINPSFIQTSSYSNGPAISLADENQTAYNDATTPSKSAQSSSNGNESSHKKSYSGKPTRICSPQLGHD